MGFIIGVVVGSFGMYLAHDWVEDRIYDWRRRND